MIRRGCDYVVQHTPDLHRELSGMSAYKASLLFIEEACNLSDVPLIFYSMRKVRAQTWGSEQETHSIKQISANLRNISVFFYRAKRKRQPVYCWAWLRLDCTYMTWRYTYSLHSTLHIKVSRLSVEYETLNFLSLQVASGEHQLLYEFAWSSIDCLKFQVIRLKKVISQREMILYAIVLK